MRSGQSRNDWGSGREDPHLPGALQGLARSASAAHSSPASSPASISCLRLSLLSLTLWALPDRVIRATKFLTQLSGLHQGQRPVDNSLSGPGRPQGAPTLP